MTTTAHSHSSPENRSQVLPIDPGISDIENLERNHPSSTPPNDLHQAFQHISQSSPTPSLPPIPSAQPSSVISDKHQTRIIQLLNSSTSQRLHEDSQNSHISLEAALPLLCDRSRSAHLIKTLGVAYHPALRSLQKRVSSPTASRPATSHLHPQFLGPTAGPPFHLSSKLISPMAPAIPTGYHSPSSKRLPPQGSNMQSAETKVDSFDWRCASASTTPHPREHNVLNPSASSVSGSTWKIPSNSCASPSESPRPPNASDKLPSVDLANPGRTPDPPPGEGSVFGWNENAASEAGVPGENPDRNSDEWKQHRKNNHKEVERRRRETINEGITELKKMIPGTEKNKGEILKQAVKYIQHLKDTEAQNAEKWAIEKLVTDRALQDQTAKLAKLSRDHVRLEAENESLKRWIIELGEKATSSKDKSETLRSTGVDRPALEPASTFQANVTSSRSRTFSFPHASTSGSERDRNGSPRAESLTRRDEMPDLATSSTHDTPVSSIRDQLSQVDGPESNIHHLLRSASDLTGAQKRESGKDLPSSVQFVLERDRLTVKRTKLV